MSRRGPSREHKALTALGLEETDVAYALDGAVADELDVSEYAKAVAAAIKNGRPLEEADRAGRAACSTAASASSSTAAAGVKRPGASGAASASTSTAGGSVKRRVLQ
jgi:thiazole synthase ThiGH ThiG subunit